MRYICNSCKSEFEEPFANKEIASLLARSLMLFCPYCKSEDIDLTELSRLRLNRKAKINKIESDTKPY